MTTDYLVWLDLEMTGLDSQKDLILEIATVITDIDLNIVENGPELAIFTDDDQLARMNEWCVEHHSQSGLIDRVKQSKVSVEEAERQTIDFLEKYVQKEASPLCGNSIHQDRNFLRVHMPNLCSFVHYRNIDVSTIKELTFRWYPDMPRFEKQNKHTALEDIHESIAELNFYREKVFIA